MPQINNLQLEVIRRRKQLQFIKMVEDDDNSQEINTQQPLKNSQEFNKSYKVGKKNPIFRGLKSSAITNGEMESSPALFDSSSLVETKQSLELQDTEHPELKVGYQRNGRKYSVRTNRKRFFFPKEWLLFLKNLDNENQARCYDILINTGARYNECKHIKKEDIDFERSTLTIKVAKIKAKKGQKFPDPRTFKLSSQFLERLKTYTKNLNDSDTIHFLTNSNLNILLKKITEKIGLKDPYMFSVHNLRKTHGNWLVAMDFNIVNICKRLGHDYNTFLKAYASADTFNDEDRELIPEILGDLIPKNKVPFTGGLIK